jgi:3-hydroxypropanoate dehydrogenase
VEHPKEHLMPGPLAEPALAQLFTEARSHHLWKAEPVSDDTLRRLYDLMKWGPTSVNANPARLLLLRSPEAKERLYPALLGSNVEQVRSAPVTAIVAYDERYIDLLPRLFPAYDVKPLFEGDAKLTYDTAFRNSSLQGAYLIIAARALGLDTCPMSGFDNQKVDEAFFRGTTWRANFLCTLGHGDAAGLSPRGPRLAFEEACRLL